MKKNEKNNIFHIYFVISQYNNITNPSGDFCPILSRSQNIVHPNDQSMAAKFRGREADVKDI